MDPYQVQASRDIQASDLLSDSSFQSNHDNGRLAEGEVSAIDCKGGHNCDCVSFKAIMAESLQRSNFSSIDLVHTEDLPDLLQGGALTVHTVHAEKSSKAQDPIVCLSDKSFALQCQIVKLLQDRLGLDENLHFQTKSLFELEDIDFTSNPSFVLLADIEGSLLADLDERVFKALQHLTKRARFLLWVTANRRESPVTPESAMIHGFARVLGAEMKALSFITASLEDHSNDPEKWVVHISNILRKRDSDAAETEYYESGGTLHVNRLIHFDSLDSAIQERSQAVTIKRELHRSTPLMLEFSNPGFLDSARFVPDFQSQDMLEPWQLEIQVHAIGINFRDLFVALGKYTGMGCDCSGIVTRIGSQVDTFSPGDRVCAMKLGCFRSLARCHFKQALRIPETLDILSAAAFPTIASTAYYSLVTVGRLSKEDSILIHSGAGGTGQMAIQIAKSIGAEIFTTVSSPEKTHLLMNHYGIPKDHIFHSRDPSFANRIMRATQNQGVNVILNSLSGDSLIASWECIAPYGRFLEIEKTDVEKNTGLPMAHFKRNVSFSVIAMDQISEERLDLLHSCLASAMEMFKSGILQIPSPIEHYPVSKLEDALRLMQSGRNIGKLVIAMSPEDLVPVSKAYDIREYLSTYQTSCQTCLPYKSSYFLPPDVTYIIAGGLGGLGRSAARWMVYVGARNLILLSRSGPQSQAARDLIQELEAMSVRIKAPKCDLTSARALSTALEECSELSLVKGCIQGTMVLQVSHANVPSV